MFLFNDFYTIVSGHFFAICTGCNSDIWKKIQANILREPLVLLKQTIPQQKALDLSFNLTP